MYDTISCSVSKRTYNIRRIGASVCILVCKRIDIAYMHVGASVSKRECISILIAYMYVRIYVCMYMMCV